MKLQIFSVYDSKTQAWLAPFYSQTLESGTRAFGNVARDPAHDFHINAGDYTLFHLGEFGQDDGVITKLHAPTNLGLAMNFAFREPTTESPLRGIQGGE